MHVRSLSKYTISDTGCWEYAGGRSATGYGKVAVKLADGRSSTVNAHRAFYEALVGPIPEGLQLDHLCRNPSCVRPDHMEPVTGRVNTIRGWAASHPACPQGHLYTAANTRWVKGPAGYRYRRCRACWRIRDAAAKRKWRAEHPNEARARNQAYYLANRERLIAAEVARKRRRREG